MEAGDERKAARLEHREPGVHIGPHNVARAERGVYLERTKGVLHSRVGNSQEDPETSIPSEALLDRWVDSDRRGGEPSRVRHSWDSPSIMTRIC